MSVAPRDREMLATLQHDTFDYFVRQADRRTGLVADRSEPGSPCSITATGMGLAILCIAVEHGWVSRSAAATHALRTLRFLHDAPQSTEVDATGHRGFFYHFLDMQTGRRANGCELSTVDTAFLIAGVLTVATYFDADERDEALVRSLADAIYRRVDWDWARKGAQTISHGWTPESGFLSTSWNNGYSEALLLYVLALGSPTFPIAASAYEGWTDTFEEKTVYGIKYLYAGPLFIHQLSHLWIDFRDLRDPRNRSIGCDYFENSRRATLVHRQYAIENPLGFAKYSENEWGLTASDGPGPMTCTVDGVTRTFYGYVARGAPYGPDDGTISPWAVVASLPFAPELVCATLHHAIDRLDVTDRGAPGFDASFNSTFPKQRGKPHDWASPWRFGLNEGPIVMMIENHATELLWTLFRRVPYVVAGLRRADFRGGWLATVGG
jgi:hypothetical protein